MARSCLVKLGSKIKLTVALRDVIDGPGFVPLTLALKDLWVVDQFPACLVEKGSEFCIRATRILCQRFIIVHVRHSSVGILCPRRGVQGTVDRYES